MAQVVVYDNIPTTLPPDFNFSVGYEAYQASEFGGIVEPNLVDNVLSSATIAMSNWATAAAYPTYFASNNTGYNVSLTLTLYSVGAGTGVGDTPGPAIDSQTVNALIDWRTPSTGCTSPDGTADGYQIGGTGPCYGGDVQLVSFVFSTPVDLPSEFIWGLSFNTQDYGPGGLGTGTGVAGPYNSLNLGMDMGPPSVGTNPALDPSNPTGDYYDSAYWQTANGSPPNGTSGTVNVFSQDTGWISSGLGSGTVEFETTPIPEPATFGLLALGLLGFAAARKRIRA